MTTQPIIDASPVRSQGAAIVPSNPHSSWQGRLIVVLIVATVVAIGLVLSLKPYVIVAFAIAVIIPSILAAAKMDAQVDLASRKIGCKSTSWCRILRCLFYIFSNQVFVCHTPLPLQRKNQAKIDGLQRTTPQSESSQDTTSSSTTAEDEDDFTPLEITVSHKEAVLTEKESSVVSVLQILNTPQQMLSDRAFLTCSQALGLTQEAFCLDFFSQYPEERSEINLEALPTNLEKVAFPVILSNNGYNHIVHIFIDCHQRSLTLFDPMGKTAKDALRGRRNILGMSKEIDLAMLIEKLVEKYQITNLQEHTEQYQTDLHSCGYRGLLASKLFLSNESSFEEMTNADFNENLFRQTLFDKIYTRAITPAPEEEFLD